MKGRKVFIFGGTGFVGKWLLESLIAFNRQSDQAVEISVLSRNPQKFCDAYPHLNQGVKFYAGDIQSFRLPAEKFDFVVHGATDIGLDTPKNRDRNIVESLFKGTRAILNFCKSCDAGKLLLLSSGSVYGVIPTDVERVAEDFAQSARLQRPLTAYGEGKKISEQMCVEVSEQTDIKVMIARGFTFAGPYLPLDAHFAIGNFIRNGLGNEEILVEGDGTPLRAYLYGADLVVWLLRILTHGKSIYPYNVGSPDYLSIKQLAYKVGKVFPESKVVVKREAPPGVLPQRYVPAVDRASKDLELTAWTDIDQIISRMKSWYRK